MYPGSGYYGGPIIRYNYAADRIVETFFSQDNEIANDFKISEVPYQHIYHLNGSNQIIKVEQKYKIDFEWKKESFEETIKHLQLYKEYVDEESALETVFGYEFSFAKLNGVDPEQKK